MSSQTWFWSYSNHSLIPFKSSLLDNLSNLSWVGSSFGGQAETSLPLDGTYPFLHSFPSNPAPKLGMFWNVPEAGANMGGMTFAAATFVTMVPFLRVIFS